MESINNGALIVHKDWLNYFFDLCFLKRCSNKTVWSVIRIDIFLVGQVAFAEQCNALTGSKLIFQTVSLESDPCLTAL